MNFLNQFSKQISDLFATMTPGARVTAGLLLAVVVVSVGFLFQQSTLGPDEYLFGAEPLSASEINAMTAAMSQAGLNDFEVQGAHIRVPRSNRHEYIGAVAAADALPTHAKDFMVKALQEGSVFESREEKMQRMKLATEQEFSHIIGWFPWVQQASVIYDLKASRGLRQAEQASATVSVMPKPGETLNSRRARSIQKLVAGGFTSMSPEHVVVNNLGEDDFWGGAGDIDVEEFETPYHRERARIENEVRRSILSHLSHISGVRVEVSAILDKEITRQTLEVKPDPQAVSTSEVVTSEQSEDKTIDNAERPGLTINGPQGVATADTPRRENTRTRTNEKTETQSKVGESTTQTLMAGMAAKEIQASIEVPRDYVLGVWKQKQQLLTGKIPDKIELTEMQRAEDDVKSAVTNAVKPLLPKLVRESDYEQVNVVVIDTIEPVELPAPSLTKNALAWTSRNASMLAMVGVAVFSLLMLRTTIRPGKDSDADSGPILALEGAGKAPAEPEEEEEQRPKLKFRKPESLKDDLSDIVKEDPDAAAAILRNWIGSAG